MVNALNAQAVTACPFDPVVPSICSEGTGEVGDGKHGEHGGRLHAARRRFPDAPEPWIDLSTGINPWPYPVPVLSDADWTRLPEPEDVAGLERAAGDYFGVIDPACVVAVPGSDLAMRLLPGLLGTRNMAIVGPTYGGHAEAWAGRSVAIDVDALDGLADGIDGVTLVNPNNPDGRVISGEQIEAVRAALVDRGGVLIVDEAFADVLDGGGVMRGYGGAVPTGLVVLRSFGKFFGLGGLRLGFVIAEAGFARRLRGIVGAWPVSGPAVAIGTLAYRDDDWIAATRVRLDVEAARFDELLVQGGLEIVGGTALFRLVRHRQASALRDRLGARGVAVRTFADRPGLMRLGLPADDNAMDRLREALQENGQ